MDPNNSQPSATDPNLQKLQEDLQNMTSTPAPQPMTPPAPTPPVEPSMPAGEVPAPQAPPVQPPEVPKSGSPVMTIAIVLGGVAILAAVAYIVGTMFLNKGTTQKACTTEAKICPDGSSVGRAGPNCEFAACPTFVPLATESPMATATSSATASPTSTPTSSPSASPAATP